MATVTNYGLFHASYDIGSGLAGAVHCHASLAVDTVHRTVTGICRITQAVHPPLSITSHLHGTFNVMTVMPHNVHIGVTLTGFPQVHLPPGVMHMANVHLFMVLGHDWKSGTGDCSYFHDHAWHKLTNVPVKLVAGGPHVPGVAQPLYGKALQEAAASGDLAQMKLLEAQAEREVGQNPSLQPGLDALRAEITKLAGH